MPSDDDLFEFLAAARSDDAARSRAGIGSLRELAMEDATLGGLLLVCAERRSRVKLTVRSRSITGSVMSVWSAGIVIAGPRSRSVIRFGAIDALSSFQRARPDVDARSPRRSTWLELLQHNLERHDIVEIGCPSSTIRGEFETIGRSIMTVVTADGATTYVRLESIDVVTVASTTS